MLAHGDTEMKERLCPALVQLTGDGGGGGEWVAQTGNKQM